MGCLFNYRTFEKQLRCLLNEIQNGRYEYWIWKRPAGTSRETAVRVNFDRLLMNATVGQIRDTLDDPFFGYFWNRFHIIYDVLQRSKLYIKFSKRHMSNQPVNPGLSGVILAYLLYKTYNCAMFTKVESEPFTHVRIYVTLNSKRTLFTCRCGHN